MTWWRRNRWWLVVTPLALALLVAASAYRIKPYWWEADTRRVAGTASIGEWLHWSNSVEGFDGKHETYDFRVRVTALEPVDEVALGYLPAGPPPQGSDAWKVSLEIDPIKVEGTPPCELVLLDHDGVRYGGRDSRQQPLACSELATGEEAGPGDHYRTHSVLVVDEGAEITQVWLGIPYREWLKFLPERPASAS